MLPPPIRTVQQSIKTADYYASFVSTVSACFLVYSITTSGGHQGHSITIPNANVSAFVVVILIGAVLPQLDVSVAIGTYTAMASPQTIVNYGWLTLLAFTTATIWLLGLRYNLLLGYSGRLGTLAFVAMNITFIIVAATGAAPWDRYGSKNLLWAQVLTWENSVLLVASTSVSAVLAAFYRIHSRVLINPVTAATFTALLPMLIVMSIDYRYISFIIQGLATGAFVGMASFDLLGRSAVAFGVVGLFSGLWALFLQPFFLGFGGKEGFVAFLGANTYLATVFVLKILGILQILDSKRSENVKDRDDNDLDSKGRSDGELAP